MIDAFVFYNAVLRHVNTWQAGFMRPEDFASWTNDANTMLFNKLFGGEWEKSSFVDSVLAGPFYRTKNITVQSTQGKPYDKVIPPDDYGYFDSMSINFKPDTLIVCGCEGKDHIDGQTGKGSDIQEIDVCKALTEDEITEIKRNAGKGVFEFSFEKVTTNRWSAATTHPRRKATFFKPKMTITEGGFKIAPRDAGIVVFNYLKKPDNFTFNYSIGANDSIQYGTATALEWSDSVLDILVRMVGQQFAKFTGNNEMYQMLENELKKLMP